jgi:hypothetical protein
VKSYRNLFLALNFNKLKCIFTFASE